MGRAAVLKWVILVRSTVALLLALFITSKISKAVLLTVNISLIHLASKPGILCCQAFLQLFVARTSRLQQKRCSHQLQAKSLQHKSAAPAGRPSEWTSCSPFLPVASELVMSVPWNRPQLDHIGPRRPFPGWFCPCSKKNINYIDRCLALSSWWERGKTQKIRKFHCFC